MLAGSTPDPMAATSLVGAGTLVALFLGYLIGFAHAVWRRARTDYVRAKQSIPDLRSNMWSRGWSLIKRTTVVVLLFALLLAWIYSTS